MLERKVVGMAPALRLGMVRAVICAAAIVNVSLEKLASFAEVSTAWYLPAGLLKWLPASSMHSFLSSPGHLLLFQLMLLFFLVLAMVGAFTSFSLAMSSILYFLFAGILRSYGTFSNQGFVLLYLLTLMIFLPSGNGFSLDEQWRRKKGAQPDMQPDAAMGWSIFLLRTVIVFSYWQAACAKLYFTGLAWLEPGHLKKFLVQENLGVMQFEGSLLLKALHLPDTAWSFLAAFALFMELLFPLALLSWGIRRVYPLIAAAVHIVFMLLCPSLFLEGLTALCLLLAFYDWDRIFLKGLLPEQDRRGNRE